MGRVDAITLGVETEEKFRVSSNGAYTVSNIPDHLVDWVNSYDEAFRNGIELMARFQQISGFSVVKEYRRADMPVVD